MGSDSFLDRRFDTLIDAAERQRGPKPTDDLRDALNAFSEVPADKRLDALAKLANALPGLSSPAGAGFLAVWLGAGVEQGDDPEPTLGPILEAFMKWSRTIGTASGEAGEDDPEPDHETIVGMRFFGHALVAHLTRAPVRLAKASAREEVLNELDRVEHLSEGAAWVLQLLRQRSGRLVVLNVEKRKGVLVHYENLSNCFHLFTLLQGALAGVMPDARKASDRVLAIARGEQHGEATDEAWWHYGQANVPKPDMIASVWGELGPDHISRVDDEQVLLLWPCILGKRSWDSGFFLPFLDAARPKVEVTKVLSEAEVKQWRSRLRLPKPKAWWRLG